MFSNIYSLCGFDTHLSPGEGAVFREKVSTVATVGLWLFLWSIP